MIKLIKTFLPNQKIRQARVFMAEKFNDNTRKHENKMSKSIQIDVIKKQIVDNTINNQKTAKEKYLKFLL